MDNPIITKALNEAVRPLNERLRRQLMNGRDFMLQWEADMAALINGVPDATVIVDGRADVPPRTVGELRHWIAFQTFLGTLARHRGNVDQNQLQNAFNAFQNANVNAELTLVKFTVRSGIFGDL
jgi:hypothetical protein